MKSRVYKGDRLATLDDLKRKIIREFAAMKLQRRMLRKVVFGMQKRPIRCLQLNGAQAEGGATGV